jgi:hypothetical protein
MINHVNREILAGELGGPAFAPIGRSLVGHPGMTRSMHHDDRGAGYALRDAVLHVHLIDRDLSGRRRASGGRIRKFCGGDLTIDKNTPSSCNSSGPPSEPAVVPVIKAARTPAASKGMPAVKRLGLTF